MKLPKLADYFPVNNALAELYGGWLEGPYFKHSFHNQDRLTLLQQVNDFLKENGFEKEVSLEEFDDENYFEGGDLSMKFDLIGYNMIMLMYSQPLIIKPIDSLTELIRMFRDERDWKQFHTPKNLSMAISSEAGELLDLFLWDREDNINIEKASDEIADILIYLLLLSKELNVDILESVVEKIQKNNLNYPIEKSKGVAKKYNEL